MKNVKRLTSLFISMISLLATAVVLNLGLTIALFNKSVQGNGTYGEVSLRSYYECGSGTVDDPFVITRPRHLYNFSRLHGLGIYGEKKYFQLGKEDLGGIDSNGLFMCYADDSSNVQKRYLDMSGSDLSTNPINAIGSEALPFYGEFDGKDVEIKNLNVYANPQDAGLFGYTAHGSSVHNLFLSEVTIHATGYTSDYSDLYNPESTIGSNVSFVYNPHDGGENQIDLVSGYGSTIYTHYYANNVSDFEYTAQGSSPVPSVSLNYPSNSYIFTSLLSGDLITTNNDNEIIPNLTRIFSFFKEKREEADPNEPIQASSSASLVVSSIDRYGQKHSKVLITIEFDFILNSSSSDFITMGVRVTGDHGNNIGLVVGHCDGSVENCYVHNGKFKMNDGGENFNNMSNGSNLGLIGLVGGTVQNILADESDVGIKDGKNIGVLDFTTIYQDVVNENSFNNNSDYPGDPDNGVTYVPNPTTKYNQYLRHHNSSYVTLEDYSVSFKGRSIITNTDLGVFTVATDASTSGEGMDTGANLKNSVIKTEDLAIKDNEGNDDYYIYYSTGEYNKQYNQNYFGSNVYSNYQDSFNSDNPSHITNGFHFPRKEHLSRQAFDAREARHNYFIRFKLDPLYRRGKGFYFSDLDVESDGGAYLANYFNYKLVDQNSHHIAIGDKKCGVMLKNNLRQDIGTFSASFDTPDLTPGASETKAYCLQDQEGKKYVSNMVNFEIKNDMANVTVIAASANRSLPSILGVYRLDDSNDFSGDPSNYTLYFTQKYDDPDYAFFMPDDNHLSYFDYRVNSNHKGQIGTYDSSGVFTVATNSTNAVLPNEYDTHEYPYSVSTDENAISKTRLFAHTFCLPKGRYCLGSPFNKGKGHSIAKIYYVCAQGQDDGQFDFDDTVFTSNDRVENVDFTFTPRFATDGTENIIMRDISVYNPTSPTQGKWLGNRRCYIALVNSDRSEFAALPSDMYFHYDDSSGKFLIESELTGQDLTRAITHVAVDNYNHPYADGIEKHLTIVLLGIESDQMVIVYPADD